MENLTPLISQLGFGGLAGLASGYALKKIGKAMAFALGVFFIGVQLLAYTGYIEVNWTRIQKDVEPLFDQHNLQTLWQRLVEVLTYNGPFAGSFIAGLLLGLRRG